MKTTKLKLNLDLEEKYLIYASKKLRCGKSWNQFFEQTFVQLVDKSRDNQDDLFSASLDKDTFRALEKMADDKGMFITDFMRDVHWKVNEEYERRQKEKQIDSALTPDLMNEKLNHGNELKSDLEDILDLGDEDLLNL